MYGMPTTGISGWFYIAIATAVGMVFGGAKLLSMVFGSRRSKYVASREPVQPEWRTVVLRKD